MVVSVMVSMIMLAPIAVISSTVKIATNKAIPFSELRFFLQDLVIGLLLTGSSSD